MNGDLFTTIDFGALVDQHVSSGAPATLALLARAGPDRLRRHPHRGRPRWPASRRSRRSSTTSAWASTSSNARVLELIPRRAPLRLPRARARAAGALAAGRRLPLGWLLARHRPARRLRARERAVRSAPPDAVRVMTDAPWRITLADVTIGAEEHEAVREVLRSGWLSMGPETLRFEAAFASLRRHGTRASRSRTARLRSTWPRSRSGSGPGDEVICPSLTFVASAAAMRQAGATVRLADSTSLDDFSIDPPRSSGSPRRGPRPSSSSTTRGIPSTWTPSRRSRERARPRS